MKTPELLTRLCLIIILISFIACGKEPVDFIVHDPLAPLSVRREPIPLGCIRGYFGKEYKIFTQPAGQVQPVDSFSNIYYYGYCDGPFSQIGMIRCDSMYAAAIYIMGYSPDSLPFNRPVPSEFGRFSDLQFYKIRDTWNDNPSNYKTYDLAAFYGESVFITENKNDVLTGTFEGFLNSQVYGVLHVTQGEFKIKIYRKNLSCSPGSNGH